MLDGYSEAINLHYDEGDQRIVHNLYQAILYDDVAAFSGLISLYGRSELLQRACVQRLEVPSLTHCLFYDRLNFIRP